MNAEFELLKKFSMSICDVAKVLKIDRSRARVIVNEIREKNKKYYSNGFHGMTKIYPLHLAPYLDLTRDEMIDIIYG